MGLWQWQSAAVWEQAWFQRLSYDQRTLEVSGGTASLLVEKSALGSINRLDTHAIAKRPAQQLL
jgi:hypothetical protein